MDPPPRRASVVDVARVAGVSTATVDRVLNRRGHVRAATIGRVLEAARRLRYLGDEAIVAALRPAPMRLVFLLPAGTNPYLNMLLETVAYSEALHEPLNVSCRAFRVNGFDPEVLARELHKHGRRADGIAFMALEHPVVREAVRALVAQGRHVVTLVSDLSMSERAAFVGLDNRAVGRTAAWLIGRLIGARASQVALIAGSRSYRAHEEREMGFLSLIDEQFPSLKVVGLREGQDDATRNYGQMQALLGQYPKLAAIYNIGGASDGIARALDEHPDGRSVVFIGHGLTPDTRARLIDGTMDAVFTQSQQTVITNAVRIFTNLRDGREAQSGIEGLRLNIVFRENLP